MIWCYRNSHRGQCRGQRLYTINGQIIRIVGDHNHELIHSAHKVIKALTKMNSAAKQTVNTTYDIVTDDVVKLSDHDITSLPSIQNLKRTIRRIRQKYQNLLSLPIARDSSIIDQRLINTFRHRIF